jgi:hypothetical protein
VMDAYGKVEGKDGERFDVGPQPRAFDWEISKR